MKYFFPDSQDLVDPSFDFETEVRADTRLRHRDDHYAHEVFAEAPFDGILVSKGIVDGYGETGSRYSIAQRHRLLRVGAPEFFRLPPQQQVRLMGDCGAFTYVREPTPPYKVEEVIQFYVDCQFDLGLSVDHVILAFDPRCDSMLPGLGVNPEFEERRQLTLDLADVFLRTHRQQTLSFTPIGVAQGWSPNSYADSVFRLQQMGYDYIALGGMVPLKTREIISCLVAIAPVRDPRTRLHLLGVTRADSFDVFSQYGVVSFDSTSPLRQAFKDDRNNYYTDGSAYTALRIPQVDGNARLEKRIRSGQVSQEEARRLETSCLSSMKAYDAGRVSLDSVLDALLAYEALHSPGVDHSAAYRRTLEDRPWRDCRCEVCASLGYHVILFRGAERNRRRGFHNTWIFYRRVAQRLETPSPMAPAYQNT